MKFCTNCGQKISAADKFCFSCGTSVLQTEETSASLEVTPQPPRKSLFSKKWVLITSILAIFIISGSVVFGFFIQKNPKELYMLAELKSLKQTADDLNEKYGEDIEFQEKLLENPSSSEIKLSGNLEIDSQNIGSEVEIMQELLSKSALIIKSNQDPTKKASHTTLEVEMDGATAADLEVYQSDSQVGLKIPMLYDQFFYLNFDQYGQFMRMIDPYYEGPETLELTDLELEELKLSDKEIAKLTKRYATFFLKELKEENFTLEKGVKYEHDGETLKVRELTFKLSPKETERLVMGFMDLLIEDEDLHSIIAERVTKVAEKVNQGYEEDLVETSEIKEELKDGLEDMKSQMESLQYPKGLESVILIDSEEQIIDRKIKFMLAEDGGDIQFLLETKDVPLEKDNRYKEFKFEVAPKDKEQGKLVLTYTNDVSEKKKVRVEDAKYVFYFEDYGTVEADIEFGIKSEFKGENSGKQSINRDFELRLGGDEFYDVPVINGSIKQSKDISVKEKYSIQNFDIELNVEDEYESGTIFLSLDTKTNLKEKVKLPELNTAEGRNIAELSEYDVYEISEDIQYRLEEIFSDYGLGYY
ncbi:DUF6583 family protein [Bacillus sp. 31A1R]|uniref:DUF6583 family protein n=1 Tax=Robertmurraya mangrovi TaxID=3098077 RepID=A0ABU5IXT4_9BACI|nr:DUF6583 family protein [Bacillus sp. 31A1R]MDZ5471936.1 DUF6583 family protein [Bacillus sp. 31A1R]